MIRPRNRGEEVTRNGVHPLREWRANITLV
jgi:hypothetical protein